MMKPLIILKTGDSFDDVIEHRGNFEQLFAAALNAPATLPIDVVDARDVDALPDPGSLGGAVITGSHAMVTDREVWSEALKPWLRQALAVDLPLLGVCYGHQLMADALGGQAGYHPAGRECGSFAIQLDAAASDDPLFAELPPIFPAHLTHSQTVLKAPAGATVLARNAHDPHQALRYGPRQWSVQFHPEFDVNVMQRYLDHQREPLQQQGADPEALYAGICPTPQASSLLSRFARLLGESSNAA
ncbi:glutamine amidotransferase [Halomonas cupida]|uniref:glutamine amidotransferase n=1 Tax=Halomonas cupida TaxID=44933 RepID=UPI0039B68E39